MSWKKSFRGLSSLACSSSQDNATHGHVMIAIAGPAMGRLTPCHRVAADANPTNPGRRPTQREFACMHRVAGNAQVQGCRVSDEQPTAAADAPRIHMHACCPNA